MKLILQLIKKSFWKYLVATVLSAVAGVSGALMIKHIHSGMRAGTDDNYFLFFGLYLTSTVVLGVIGSQLLTKISEKNLKDLRISLSKRIMRTSYRKMELENDKIIPILTTDIATIGATAAKIPDVITSLAIVLGCMVYMAFLSWKLTLFAVGVFLINFIMTVVVMPMTRKHEESARNLRYDIFRHLRNMVNGLRELSFKKKLRREYVDRLIEPTIESQNKIKLKNTLMINSFAKIETIMMMGALAFGVYFASNSGAFESKEFMEFLALALFLIAPMAKINAFFRVINRTTAALDQIEELGLGLKRVKRPKPQKIESDGWTERDPLISFREVTHSYLQEDIHDSFTLGPFDLDVKKNETVFIIGGNGSGKTTLIQLLTGLYTPISGHIEYRGVKITDEFMDDYQNRFAALFVNDFVFQILYHIDEKVIAEKGQHYLELLELSQKVAIENHQFTTVSLSYGQRKRLNLVMAMLENKEVYVFDEWAANQDPYFKSIFYNDILGDLKARGKTVFVISHDDSYFHVADRVVKLEDGKIVANYLQSEHQKSSVSQN